MKKLLSLMIAGMLFSCSAAPAIAVNTSFGGRSSFSSSRSYSAPRTTYSAPRPAPQVTKNVTVNKTTIVRQGGNGGSGLLTGIMLGHMMSTPTMAAPPVIVQQPVPMAMQQPQVVEQAPIQAPAPSIQQVASVQEEESHWFLWTVLLLCVGGIFVYAVHNKNKG